MCNITDEQRHQRMAVMRQLEDSEPETLWILYFETGYALVMARGGLSAVQRTWELGINPGGQVEFSCVDPGAIAKIPKKALDRFLTPEDAKRLNLL